MPYDDALPCGADKPARPRWLNHTAYCHAPQGGDVIFSFGWAWTIHETPQAQAEAMLNPGETVHCITPGCYGPPRYVPVEPGPARPDLIQRTAP